MGFQNRAFSTVRGTDYNSVSTAPLGCLPKKPERFFPWKMWITFLPLLGSNSSSFIDLPLTNARQIVSGQNGRVAKTLGVLAGRDMPLDLLQKWAHSADLILAADAGADL